MATKSKGQGNNMKKQSGSDVIDTKHFRIYRIQWTRNGFIYVHSSKTLAHVATYSDLHGDNGGTIGNFTWDDNGKLPDDVRAFAMMEPKPAKKGA